MVANRATEEHKLYLFDLSHGNLSPDKAVSGFIKFYVLNGFTLGNLLDDYRFYTDYPMEGVKSGLCALRSALEKVARIDT